MTVLDIRLFGDPVLRTPAQEVTEFGPELRRLIDDMVDTMRDAPGIGLAAPQVGVGRRVFVYEIDGVLGHMINPRLTTSGETVTDDEGCLSIPGVYGAVPRPRKVVAEGVDVDGRPVRLDADGLLARCIQHETDHLDGVLFPDRMDREERKAVLKAIRDAAWAGHQGTVTTAPIDDAADDPEVEL